MLFANPKLAANKSKKMMGLRGINKFQTVSTVGNQKVECFVERYSLEEIQEIHREINHKKWKKFSVKMPEILLGEFKEVEPIFPPSSANTVFDKQTQDNAEYDRSISAYFNYLLYQIIGERIFQESPEEITQEIAQESPQESPQESLTKFPPISTIVDCCSYGFSNGELTTFIQRFLNENQPKFQEDFQEDLQEDLQEEFEHLMWI